MPLNEEQQAVFDKITSDNKNYLITGPAGTGKSFLLKTLVDHYLKVYNKEGQVGITALTGIAAINIDGVTLHSFSGLGHDLKRKLGGDSIMRWRNTKVLIIDEISMMSLEFFNLVGPLVEKYRIKLICFGDYFQLPPVNSDFCFKSVYWVKLGLGSNVIQLKTIVRQESKDFCRVLNEIRRGEISDESMEFLRKLDISQNDKDLDDYTKLYALNKNVNSENIYKLNQLEGEEYVLESKDIITDKYTKKEMKPNDVRSDYSILQTMINKESPRIIRLKIGAKVMLTRNIPQSPYVNGLQGIITDIKKYGHTYIPTVKFYIFDEPMPLYPIVFEIKYKNVIYSRHQVPIKLAWAISAHKSQGQTLDKVLATLHGSFEKGQIYTVLSRVRDHNNLVIDDVGTLQHLNKVCPEVKELFKT